MMQERGRQERAFETCAMRLRGLYASVLAFPLLRNIVLIGITALCLMGAWAAYAQGVPATASATAAAGNCPAGTSPDTTILGMYVGNAVDPTVAQWLGRPVDFWTTFVGNASWSDIMPGWALSALPVPAPPSPKYISIPLIPDGATLEDAAAGDYNNYYLQMAKELDAVTPDAIIRTGWEFNGNWMPWSAINDPQAFIGAWQQFVTVFRSVSPGFKFDWTPSMGNDGMNPELAYPGDAYVDYIGMDVYDNSQYTSGSCAQRWNTYLTEPYGLNWQVQFAAEHGDKPLSYPEWGSNYDDGCLIDNMAQWFKTHNVAYQAYWNSDSAFPGGSLDEDPVNKAAYIAAFGGADAANGCYPDTTPAVAGAPPVVNPGGIEPATCPAGSNGTSGDGGATACGDQQTTATPTTAATALGGECGGCGCEDFSEVVTRNLLQSEYDQEREFITEQFNLNQNYLTNDFFTADVGPGLMMMTEQLVTNGMNQMLALGAIMDAKVQMDTQRLLQRRTADAHKDYQTDNDICVYGTAVSHMPSSDLRGRLTAHVLAKRSLDRQLGNRDGSAADGPDQDALARLQVVRNQYCNPNDNLENMQDICYPGGPAARRNRDIDYARVMGNNTLDLNFSDATVSNDEADIFALSNYLYAQHPFERIPNPAMQTMEAQKTWLDARAVIAKHAVAENSFDNIVGMRSTSPDDMAATAQYLAVVFQRMGVSQQDAQRIVGGMDDGSNALNKPSYYSMLQIISQAIYQTPSFYANLYDTPVNVRRKEVAMQASRLMVDRDTYVSELREEAVLDELLEAEVVKGQKQLSAAASKLRRGERTNPPP